MSLQHSKRSEHGVQQSPYLRTEQCAAYLKFRSVKTFRNWLLTVEGQRLPRVWRGGVMLFDVRLIDRLLAIGKLRVMTSRKFVHDADSLPVAQADEKSRKGDR